MSTPIVIRFPALSEVQLEFHIPRLNLYRADDEDDFELLADLDAEVGTRMQLVRDEVFPRSVAALGQKSSCDVLNKFKSNWLSEFITKKKSPVSTDPP
jgi:hypothetical protein